MMSLVAPVATISRPLIKCPLWPGLGNARIVRWLHCGMATHKCQSIASDRYLADFQILAGNINGCLGQCLWQFNTLDWSLMLWDESGLLFSWSMVSWCFPWFKVAWVGCPWWQQLQGPAAASVKVNGRMDTFHFRFHNAYLVFVLTSHANTSCALSKAFFVVQTRRIRFLLHVQCLKYSVTTKIRSMFFSPLFNLQHRH